MHRRLGRPSGGARRVGVDAGRREAFVLEVLQSAHARHVFRATQLFDDIQHALPQGMTIHRNLFRSADFIEQSLHNLFTALMEGAGLVIVVVVVFLMNVRAAAITLLALPLSLLAAVVALADALCNEDETSSLSEGAAVETIEGTVALLGLAPDALGRIVDETRADAARDLLVLETLSRY